MRTSIALLAAPLALAALVTLTMPAAHAADTFTVTIKDHKFTPAELKVPANKRRSEGAHV